jgi:hypothetical protein
VGREVVLADVCLDLDDPARPPLAADGIRGPDEPEAEQRRRDLECRPAEELAEFAQLDGVLGAL